jgi:hypothetical protein
MRASALYAAVVAATAASCGGSDPSAVPVSGAVTLDGTPLPEADLDFTTDDGNPPQRVEVRAGRFEGAVKPGKYKVVVKAYRPAKPPRPAPPGMPVDQREQYLSARYNRATELTAEVTADGPNDLAFPLKTRP